MLYLPTRTRQPGTTPDTIETRIIKEIISLKPTINEDTLMFEANEE